MSLENLNIDLETATLADLDTLDMSTLLGGDLGDYNLSSNMPDCTVLVRIEKFELTRREAKPDEQKKAQVQLAVTLRVVKGLACADDSIDVNALENRVHIERYNLLHEMGISGLIKLMLGCVGVKFTDKAAIAELGQNPAALLEELKANSVVFGVQIKTKERNGYENTNVVGSQKAFISMEDAQQYL